MRGTRRAILQELRGNDRAGIEADRAFTDQVSAAHGDQVRSPRPCSYSECTVHSATSFLILWLDPGPLRNRHCRPPAGHSANGCCAGDIDADQRAAATGMFGKRSASISVVTALATSRPPLFNPAMAASTQTPASSATATDEDRIGYRKTGECAGASPSMTVALERRNSRRYNGCGQRARWKI